MEVLLLKLPDDPQLRKPNEFYINQLIFYLPERKSGLVV
mgnify:CR=1 FL=1